MDEIKRNVPKTFDRVSGKVKYLFVLTAMVAVAAVGYTFLPEAEVSAQERGETKAAVEAPEVATQMMLDFALNLHTASEYTVYAERGITERGNSTVRGEKGSALRSEAGRKSTRDLSNSIDAIRQLPCTQLKSSDLTGRSFNPGVYCMDSAELAGEMTLDSEGSTTGVYVFRVAGTLNAKGGSSIRLENGAQGGNVFFVAEEAEIGDNASFRANILTKGNTRIGAGATVTDRVLSLGKVEMNDSALMGGTTGTMEICKAQQLPVTAANSLSNQIFFYTVTGATGIGSSAANPVRVRVGFCSGPFDVTAGPQIVSELNNGELVTPAGAVFEGNFELISVQNLTPQSTSTLGLVNLAARTAQVTIVAGGVPQQLTLRFTNRRTITGFIEICKRAARGPGTANPAPTSGNPLGGGDLDVTGFFQYTIEDVYSVSEQNPNRRVLQIFTVPVGQCSGPIAVTKGDPPPAGNPRQSLVFVSELPRAGFYLEDVIVTPTGRLAFGPVLGTIVEVDDDGNDVFTPAPGGGYVDVVLQESATSASETLLIFVNRSNPGLVKVCKIAGLGIPVNTLFTFTVNGIGATLPVNPQSNVYAAVSRTFDVPAGTVANPGCAFVPGFGAPGPPVGNWDEFQTFVNGTRVNVFENGISVNNTIPQNPGQLRASRVTVQGTVFAPANAFAPFLNPDLEPAASAANTFSTGPISVPITDNTAITIPVNVPQAGTITDVNAQIRLSHTFDADLFLGLISPSNIGVVLSDSNGGAGDNYGSGATNCTGTFTTFDDEAATGIAAGTAPFNGSFRPEGVPPAAGLSAYDGGGMNGNWQFFVADQATLDTGTVHCAQLVINSSSYVARAAVTMRASVIELEFINFRFRPTDLKVCKIAGSPALINAGAPFSFTVALVDPLAPAFTQTVSMQAGAPGGQGNCVFVNGSSLQGGAFNQGSTITVTEAAAPGTALTAISCPSSPAGNPPGCVVSIPGRSATLSGPNGLVAGINAVLFTNVTAAPVGDRAVRYDFDGDRKADASIFRRTTGEWAYRESASGQIRGTTFGQDGDIVVTADYNNDRKSDVAVWRPSNGTWYIHTGSTFLVHEWGQNGDIPQVGDFDGDGTSDLGIFRPSNGTWYMRNSTNGFNVSVFGVMGDKPVAADYDGDGLTDVAVFRGGMWYISSSSAGFRAVNFGQNLDIAVPADYDGDGKADIAVYRVNAGVGTWYTLTSGGQFTVREYGQTGDVPSPADYDGDGKTDIAVFRPSQGRWYVKRSSALEGGSGSPDDQISLGQAGDTAIPGAQ